MAKPAPPVEMVEFNVEETEPDSYANFISALRGKLAGKAGKNIRGNPIMDDLTRSANPPPRWIYVVLLTSGGTVNPKVAIRSDNADITGFTNSNGDWFQFKSCDFVSSSKKTRDAETKTMMLPNATMLPFTGDYHALTGGDYFDNVPQLKLGRVSTLSAASVLWSHKKKNIADEHDGDNDLKRALATLAVTLCEAAKFIPVHDVVANGWGSEQGVSVNTQQVYYINRWIKISAALNDWAADGFRNDEKWFNYYLEEKEKQRTGIYTADRALEVVHLILDNPVVHLVPNNPPEGEEPEAGKEGPAAAGEE